MVTGVRRFGIEGDSVFVGSQCERQVLYLVRGQAEIILGIEVGRVGRDGLAVMLDGCGDSSFLVGARPLREVTLRLGAAPFRQGKVPLIRVAREFRLGANGRRRFGRGITTPSRRRVNSASWA